MYFDHTHFPRTPPRSSLPTRLCVLIFKNKTCPNTLGCVTLSWIVLDLPGAMPLRKTDFFLSQKHSVTNFSSARGGTLRPRLTPSLCGLSLCRSCSGCSNDRGVHGSLAACGFSMQPRDVIREMSEASAREAWAARHSNHSVHAKQRQWGWGDASVSEGICQQV